MSGVLCGLASGGHSPKNSTFAGNAQHTANYLTAAQRLSTKHWSAWNDLITTGGSAHYGQSLVTPSNTVLVLIRVSTSSFEISAYDGPTGRVKYNLTNEFVQISDRGWTATYSTGPRLARRHSL